MFSVHAVYLILLYSALETLYKGAIWIKIIIIIIIIIQDPKFGTSMNENSFKIHN